MNNNWSAADIPDLTGKVIIVTGGNSGLGYESVKAFAKKGAEVILACRLTDKGEKAKAEIMQNNPNWKIKVGILDLMDLESVKNFAEHINKSYKRLDVLLNNAGIMTTPYFRTKDGFEGQMGTNHLGHFALTGLLINLITITPRARVVNVSSIAHKQGKMNFDNLLYENGKDYSPMSAYGRSKLSNLLFTYELQRLFEKNGINCFAVVAHPGVSQTNLGRHIEGKLWFRIFRPLIMLITQTQDQGALPQIKASVNVNIKGGDYYGPNGLFEMTGYPVLVKSNKASHSLEDARKLWEISEKLTGIKFGNKIKSNMN